MSELTLVAAMARNRVIGNRGGMPWHLPADLKHFKAITSGRPIVMGRRTFESIGRALPKRTNIVVSRSCPDLPEGVICAASLDDALDAAGPGRVMVIGGGQIYREALPRADRMELTFIDLSVGGDTRFPAWSAREWQLVAMVSRPADADNSSNLVFATFERSATGN